MYSQVVASNTSVSPVSVSSLMQKLGPRAQQGSNPRCHWLTHGTRREVAGRLTGLAQGWGTVSEEDNWMPDGFCPPEEARLDESQKLVSAVADRGKLSKWWLAVPQRANTPNWDIASTCTVHGVQGGKGLLLVEAKAHHNELKNSAKGKQFQPNNASHDSRSNHHRIGAAIHEANTALTAQTKLCWALSRDKHYQMSNRFAWAWKLTELGYPVILVYLGFLKANEMHDRGTPFDSCDDWKECVKEHSQPLFPVQIWNQKWTVHGRAFVPCIHSLTMSYDAPI